MHPDGEQPRLFFQRREKTPAPEPALRLELAADDVDGEVERLLALGATRAREGLLLDPDSNAFVVGAA